MPLNIRSTRLTPFLGLHRTSVSYTSPGHRRFNQPFTPTSNYAPPYVRGDVVGCGYRPRTGTVFFTRNGKKLDDVTHSLKTQNLFPTVGATGPCSVHVNFGQMGFVLIEANVKKWGLAPITGSLAPPPPYGSEAGSILLEGGQQGIPEGQGRLSVSGGGGIAGWAGTSSGSGRSHARTRSAQVRLARQQPTSPGPQRSPTDISLTQLSLMDDDIDEDDDLEDAGEGTSAGSQHLLPQEIANEAVAYSDLGIEAPPPDYESPDSDDEERRHLRRDKARAAGSDDYDDDNDDSGSGDETVTPRPGTAQRRRRREDEGEDAGDEGDETQPEERRRLLQPPPRTSSRSAGKPGDPPSPPIPSYDVAVGSSRS